MSTMTATARLVQASRAMSMKLAAEIEESDTDAAARPESTRARAMLTDNSDQTLSVAVRKPYTSSQRNTASTGEDDADGELHSSLWATAASVVLPQPFSPQITAMGGCECVLVECDALSDLNHSVTVERSGSLPTHSARLCRSNCVVCSCQLPH